MDVDRLRAIPLFEGLSRRDLDRLSGWTDELHVPVGTRLLDQGRYAYEFFVIAEGQVEVRQDRHPIATLGPGDFFGEIGLLEDARRSATIETLTPVRAVVMDVRSFDAMMTGMPAVADRVRAIEQRRLSSG